MINPEASTHYQEVQAQIRQLTNRFEAEVKRIESTCNEELAELKKNCEQHIASAAHNFNNKLKDLHHIQLLRIKELEQELFYLHEMNYSQNIMLKDKLSYIKELEAKINDSGINSKEV